MNHELPPSPPVAGAEAGMGDVRLSEAPANAFDAATLGFVDLREHPPAMRPDGFDELRTRLFGDIDLADVALLADVPTARDPQTVYDEIAVRRVEQPPRVAEPAPLVDARRRESPVATASAPAVGVNAIGPAATRSTDVTEVTVVTEDEPAETTGEMYRLDWTQATPLYTPQLDDPVHRPRVLLVLSALTILMALIGSWLLYG